MFFALRLRQGASSCVARSLMRPEDNLDFLSARAKTFLSSANLKALTPQLTPHSGG